MTDNAYIGLEYKFTQILIYVFIDFQFRSTKTTFKEGALFEWPAESGKVDIQDALKTVENSNTPAFTFY